MCVFFLKEVAIQVNCESYSIRIRYNEYIDTDFCKKPLNKKLSLRAVAN